MEVSYGKKEIFPGHADIQQNYLPECTGLLTG